jgi:hypothetical protein
MREGWLGEGWLGAWTTCAVMVLYVLCLVRAYGIGMRIALACVLCIIVQHPGCICMLACNKS